MKIHLILASTIDEKNETERGVLTACKKYCDNTGNEYYNDRFIATFNKELVTCKKCLDAKQKSIYLKES